MWHDYAVLLFNENYAQDRFAVNEIEETFKFSVLNKTESEETQKIEENTPGGGECIICCENDANTVIVSCGHQALCETCATTLTFKECPMCRTPITGAGIIKVFKC